ncbi:MAG: glycoside hydrolase family 127 protein [Sedimentisphaerales bacterium]|nr:glycoside hydrolase family 127 protein [Sedimentisphaerales bacterium]
MLESIKTNQIKLDGEIGRRIEVTIKNNLYKINVDEDFIKPFKDKTLSDGFVGTGKLIDALVALAAYSGEKPLLELKQHVVSELLSSQEPNGYIGTIKPESRLWQLWDIHEIAFVIRGLTRDYELFRNAESLAAAIRLADFLISEWSKHPGKNPAPEMTDILTTLGVGEALLALSIQTNNDKYFNFCVEDRKLSQWDDPIVVGRHTDVSGHVYAYVCKCIEQLDVFRHRGDAELLSQSKRVMRFLRKQQGLLITGSAGYHECWHDNQQGFFKLGETCATVYLLKLWHNLLQIEGASIYGDLMERAIYNALFAAQSPDGRKLRYYSPYQGERAYFDKDNYCCPNNYRRGIADLPEYIYYKNDHGITVNLFAQSTATVELSPELSVEIEQKTDYPNSGNVLITVKPSSPATFSISLRIPRWCDNAGVSVNGEDKTDTARNGYFTILQKWQAGDIITLRMPMEFRLIKGQVAQAGRVAVVRGPIVFGLNPKLNPRIPAEHLGLIRLDPTSVTGPQPHNQVRPDGLACRAKAWSPDSYVGEPDLDILLSEFADPQSEQTFILVPDPHGKALVEDELVEIIN